MIAIRVALLLLLVVQYSLGRSWMVPSIPKGPSAEEILEHHDLDDADDGVLLNYVGENLPMLGFSLLLLDAGEENEIQTEYLRRKDAADGSTKTWLPARIKDLRQKRLDDPRRVADAVVRMLGTQGSVSSIERLVYFGSLAERPWVAWKSFASVQEILARVDPGASDPKVTRRVPVGVLAPLLRDLDEETASKWAWFLWEQRRKSAGGSFYSNAPLRTRVWLARAFAVDHPDVALEVFRDGLRSHDAALRTATEMFVRAGMGGSLPPGVSADDLLEKFSNSNWNATVPIWEVLPIPLSRPVLFEQYGGRADLMWLNKMGEVARSEEDVWPTIVESLPNGLFYSQVRSGGTEELALSNEEGVLHARIHGIKDWGIALAEHGGLWARSRNRPVEEIFPDGSVLWACPPYPGGGSRRMVAPMGKGHVVILGYREFECRDRRGDLLWTTSLEKLDDPRYIVPVSEDRFLVSCTKSIGWVNRQGEYDVIVDGLRSASWVRYHPTEPCVVFDGGLQGFVVFDPDEKKVLGRFDFEQNRIKAKSRFPFSAPRFPE